MTVVPISARARYRQYELRLPGFFRLDLTVNALRRLPSNVVDVLTSEKRYIRAFDEGERKVIVSVEQSGARKLIATVEGDPDDGRSLQTMRRMLGLDCDLAPFNLRPRPRKVEAVSGAIFSRARLASRGVEADPPRGQRPRRDARLQFA